MFGSLNRIATLMAMMALGEGAGIACQGPVGNQVSISSRNQILWNGAEIDRLTLLHYIRITETMNPVPELFFDHAPGANCGIVRNVARSILSQTSVKPALFGSVTFSPPEGRGCGIRARRGAEHGNMCGPPVMNFLVRPD